MAGIILRPKRPKFPRKYYDRLRQIQKMHAGQDVRDPAQPTPKVPINIRVDADVLQFFKRRGRGYQTRMNAVLRAFMRRRLAAADAGSCPDNSSSPP